MTARAPFVADTVAFQGVGQPKIRAAVVGSQGWWLGRPGSAAGMVQLPFPSLGFEVPSSSGTVASASLAGATTTFRRRNRTRSWQLHWDRMAGADFARVDGFYLRLFGVAPWALITPLDVNRIETYASLCGSGNGAVEGWAVSAGTIAYDASVAQQVPPCGVMRWAGAGLGSLLVNGTVPAGTPTPDVSSSAPYLPAEFAAFQCYAWTASGTASIAARLSGRQADGTVATELTATAVMLTAAPQLLTVVAGPGDLTTSPYVLPVLRCGTGSAPDILVTTPQFTYLDGPVDWITGSGVPRVTMRDEPTRTVDGLFMSAVTATLAE